MTLADEDINSMLTDNANRAIQGNVAMRVTQPSGQLWNQAMQVMSLMTQFRIYLQQIRNALVPWLYIWWPNLQPMQVAPSGGQIWD